MLMFLSTALTSAAVEAFISGAACAVTLYCGKKTPISKTVK